MSSDCLHCVLKEVAEKWLRDHGRATPEDVLNMIGHFLTAVLGKQFPEMDVHVLIAGIKADPDEGHARPAKEQLH